MRKKIEEKIANNEKIAITNIEEEDVDIDDI